MTPAPQKSTVGHDLLVIFETPGAAIACDLTGASDTADERIAEYGRLFAQALIARDRSADAVEFAFAPMAGVAEWVADLARRESACCPFFSYRVSVHDQRVVWRISSQAGPAAQATLDEFYAGPERFGDGMTGLLDRLADRGFTVSTPAPGRLALDERPPGVLDRIKAACGC